MFDSYKKEVMNCLDSVSKEDLNKIIRLINNTAKNGGSIFVVGNGGSSAISSHFVIDLLKSFSKKKIALHAQSLVDSIPTLSAIGNDIGFEEIFAWQIKQFATEGDLLVAITSSGNSQNIIKAIESARALNLRTISISGFDGGLVSKISDVSLVTHSPMNKYGPVEDAHSILCHYISINL